MFSLPAFIGFDWDDGNRTKNWDKHEVAQYECEEIFFNRPLLIVPDKTHSPEEARYYSLGRTNGGRELALVFTVRGELLRVISARPMSRSERRLYAEEGA